MEVEEIHEGADEGIDTDLTDNHEIHAIHIDANSFYRPAELKKIFGIRFVNHLTTSGLRSLGSWYSGKRILEAYEQAAQNKSSQRVSAGKEDVNEAKHAEIKVEKAIHRRKIQPVPRSEAEKSLRGQLEKMQRQLR